MMMGTTTQRNLPIQVNTKRYRYIKLRNKCNFSLFRYDRNDVERKSLMILAKNSIKIEVDNNVKTKVIECMTAKIYTMNGPIDIMITYFAGINSPYVKNICDGLFGNSTTAGTRIGIAYVLIKRVTPYKNF